MEYTLRRAQSLGMSLSLARMNAQVRARSVEALLPIHHHHPLAVNTAADQVVGSRQLLTDAATLDWASCVVDPG